MATSSIYDSMVRMAQPWAMRYTLVNGQGNFGSMDGDPPAAYRYTEAKMERLADELLADIEKETVDFRDNYDGTHRNQPYCQLSYQTYCLTVSLVLPLVWPPTFHHTT